MTQHNTGNKSPYNFSLSDKIFVHLVHTLHMDHLKSPEFLHPWTAPPVLYLTKEYYSVAQSCSVTLDGCHHFLYFRKLMSIFLTTFKPYYVGRPKRNTRSLNWQDNNRYNCICKTTFIISTSPATVPHI